MVPPLQQGRARRGGDWRGPTACTDPQQQASHAPRLPTCEHSPFKADLFEGGERIQVSLPSPSSQRAGSQFAAHGRLQPHSTSRNGEGGSLFPPVHGFAHVQDEAKAPSDSEQQLKASLHQHHPKGQGFSVAGLLRGTGMCYRYPCVHHGQPPHMGTATAHGDRAAGQAGLRMQNAPSC